jgi:predicted metalloprotease with PDZ domain
MKSILFIFSILSLSSDILFAGNGEEPKPAPPIVAIAAPEDKPHPGVIHLAVDATETDPRILRVHETIPIRGGDIVLYYPKWVPGTHGPEGPIDRFAGLMITARGVPIEWTRDTVDIYAFHMASPKDTTTLDIDFQYFSPTSESVGKVEIGPDIPTLRWSSVVLYPAGYFARQISVEASASLPAGETGKNRGPRGRRS